jgi:hypothetical protein
MPKELSFETRINQVKTDVVFTIDKGGHSSWDAMNPYQYHRTKRTPAEEAVAQATYNAEHEFKNRCDEASMSAKLRLAAKHWTVVKGRFYFSYGAACRTEKKEIAEDGTLIDIDEEDLKFSTQNSSMQSTKFFRPLYYGLKVTM